MKRSEAFQSIKTVGGLITTELLQRIAAGDSKLEGLKPEDYHLSGLKPGEATSRAWYALQAAWGKYQEVRGRLESTDLGTGVARDRWLLPLFQELGYGRLQPVSGLSVDEKPFPISHMWGTCPFHLVGHGIGLDERTQGARGAARQSPHSLVQEYLNRSNASLWGFVSNGLVLRLLRDNVSLTRQAFIEFDLEAMMEQEAYADFVLLWLLCHESRVAGERSELCWLEKWSHTARQEGSRALDSLRNGVEEAIRRLGEGFLAHPRNAALHEKLSSGDLKAQDYYRQLLRTIYRMLFLLVAEARGLLLSPGISEVAAERYMQWYSITRLRNLAEKRRGGKHPDLWQGLRLVFNLLGSRTGQPELGIPALGSYLWSGEAVLDLGAAELSNSHLFAAIRALSQVKVDNRTSRVDFNNLGAEELGSIYEALLELHPDFTPGFGGFKLDTASGNERKTTGSYYTPTSLISELLDSALMPVMENAEKEGRKTGGTEGAVKALLNLKVCDPACGSGHFLIAAAHRIAKRLAAIRTGEDEPTPEPYRKALRDVISHCIYGVDLNPMAVELCKVSMWLEALDPGKPLSFLDHHIKCGNSLIGATPELIEQGIPDGAFCAITGDDKPICAKLKKFNKQQRESGQLALPLSSIRKDFIKGLTIGIQTLETFSDDSIERLVRKEEFYRLLIESANYQELKLVADMWCAAFFLPKRITSPVQITTGMLLQTERNPGALPEDVKQATQETAEDYLFFHWHLEFPDVFSPQEGQEKGFSAVLGNPPWERIKLQEKEWFAVRIPEIANARNKAEREKLIKALPQTFPLIHTEFEQAVREAESSSIFVRESGRFPLCGRGDVNTYTIFAELNRNLISAHGRAGCIVPSGIATDDTTKEFFQSLTDSESLVSLFDFENRNAIFPGVHRSYKFCLLTMAGEKAKPEGGAEFVFFAQDTADLKDTDRRFSLSAQDIALLNPNTRTCPIFRSKRDAELTKAIYRRVPVLIREARDGHPEDNPWGISFMRMFDMSNDSHLFRTREQLEAEGWMRPQIPSVSGWSAFQTLPPALMGTTYVLGDEVALPLYEAKMIHHFDHRWGTFSGSETRDMTSTEKASPYAFLTPRYWIPQPEIEKQIVGQRRSWFLGFRNVCRSTDVRSFLASIYPWSAAGNSLQILQIGEEQVHQTPFLVSCLTSFVFDFAVRQKVPGVNMNFFIVEQLPVLPPSVAKATCSWFPELNLGRWVKDRVVRLVCTSWDIMAFAREFSDLTEPIPWDENERFRLRCELDAAFFHLYGCSRDETDYIMDQFPVVRDEDIKKYGAYRTKDTILSIHDSMQHSIDTGEPYQTLLDPPPADPRVAHNG